MVIALVQPAASLKHEASCQVRDDTGSDTLTRKVCCQHGEYQSWINAGRQIFDIPAARIASDYCRSM